VSATFNVADKLTIVSTGKGVGKVECEVGASGRFGACASEYAEGTKLTLKGVVEPGSSFAGWSAGTGSAASCSGRFSCSFTLSAGSSVSATFDVMDKLTIVWAGRGVGRVSCEVESSGEFEVCAGEYLEGTKLTLKGVAEGGSSFAGFSGGSGSASACSGNADCSFTLSAESSLTATFDVLPTPNDKLTIAKAGSGSGKVQCEVGAGSFEACAGEYPEGTKLTLKGEAEAGSSFAGFSAGSGSASACSGTGNCTFTLSAESAVTASFNQTQSQLVAEPRPIGSGGVLSFTYDAVTPPPEGSGTLTALGAAAVSQGKAMLKLSCSSAGPCRGTLTLTIRLKQGHKTGTVVVGRVSYAVAAGQRETVGVRLSAAAVSLLRHHGTVTATLSGPGVHRTVALTLVAARK
jgi:hypothetical protein